MKWCVKIALLLVAGLGGCRGCDDENVPPVEKPVSASFAFYDQVGRVDAPIGTAGAKLLETDTFYLSKSGTYEPIRIIYMAADTSVDTYTWKVGDDPRTFNGKASALNFNAPGTYPVTLKVTRTTKDGKVLKDSLSKSFVIIKEEFHPIIGKYIGYNVSKPDSLFKFFIGHGSQGTFPWIMDTSKQFSGYAGIVMTGLQGAIYNSNYLAISTMGGYTDDACNKWLGFEGNYCIKDVFALPNKSYDSIFVYYRKLKIPAQGSLEPPFENEKFIGKRYL